MNKYLLHIPLLCVFLLTGCVVIPLPYERPFKEETVQFIEVGSTTREEVILTLGQPDVVARNETLFVYAAESATGFVAIYSGGGGVGRGYWYLVIEFDQDSTVERHEIVTASIFAYPCTTNGICVVPGSKGVLIAPEEEDKNAKKFRVNPEKCSIYIYRSNRNRRWWAHTTGRWWSPIYLNGRYAGLNYYEGYFLWEADPGQIVVSSGSALGKVTFPCEAGKTYFVRQVMPLSVDGNVVNQLVDESEGRDDVDSGRLILGSF